jgi:hypothetical protein
MDNYIHSFNVFRDLINNAHHDNALKVSEQITIS